MSSSSRRQLWARRQTLWLLTGTASSLILHACTQPNHNSSVTGSAKAFFLLQVLEQAGLQERDVKLVNIFPDGAAAAYQAGKVEIAVTYSPFLNKANKAVEDGRIIFDSSKMPTAIADLYTFESEFIEKNPQTVEAFVRGIFKGLDFLQTNREEGLAIAAKSLGITPKDLAEQLAGIQLVDLPTNIEMLTNPQSELYMLKPMEALAKFLKEQGEIKQVPDLAKVIEPKFAQAVQSGISVTKG